MKYLIVICVLIYFEFVASYPYGEEYSKATQPPSERRLQFSNFPQPQYAPPGIYYQNGFASESAKPYFGNAEGQGGYRASNVPLKPGLDLKPVQGQSYDNLLLGNQLNKSPVQLPPRQLGFNTKFLNNPAKLSQLHTQNVVPVPHHSVDESYLKPVLRPYPSVDNAKNIGHAAAVIRPQYYSNDKNLPLVNVPSSPSTVNIKKLQNYPLQIKELNSNNIGVVQKKYSQELPSNLPLPNIAGNNIQLLLNNPKLRDVLASTKNKKRYMVIYPNGQVEHLDSIERIAAQHPNHLVLNSSAINKIRDTLRSPFLTTSNVSPSPALPLYSNVPSHSPAIPLKSNTSSSPTLRPPQVPLLNIPRPPVIPLVPNTSSSSAVLPSTYPSQHLSTSISKSPSIPLKSNAQSSLVVQSTKVPSNLKNSLASTSAVVVNTPVSLPVVPPTIPISQKLTYKLTSVPASPNLHVSSKQKPANELPLLQQLHLPAPLVSSDSEKTGKRSISSPEIDSTHSTSNFPIKATQKPVLQPSTKTPMTSPTSTISVPEKTLPLTITEVNSKSISSNHSPVTTSSTSVKKSYQTIGSKDIHTISLSSEDKKNKYTPSVEILSKPVAMVSPTPVTPSAPIDLADLFPITKEEDANVAELSNSAVTHNNTTKSTESLTTTSDSNALDHAHYHTNSSTTDDDKQTVNVTVSNVSTSADEEQKDKIENELEVTNSNNSLQTREIKSSVSTSSAKEQQDKIGKELEVTNSNNSLQTSTSSDEQQDKKGKELEETNLNNSLQKPKMKSNTEERCDPSASQIAVQKVSDEDAQSESLALYNNESTSFDSPSSQEEQSNTDTDAATSKSKNIPTKDDTTSASSSIGSDKTIQQLSSIVAADERSDGKIDLIEEKKNMFWFTQPTYDQIWNKLLEDGAVTMVYIIEMPSHNNNKNEEVKGIVEHYLKTHEDQMQMFNAPRREDETSN